MPTETEPGKPIPIAEAARQLGITIREVYQRIDAGDLATCRDDHEMLVILEAGE